MGREEQLHRLGELFIQVGKRMRVAEATRFGPYGVTPAQGRILGVLDDSPKRLRMRDVADVLGVVPRAVTPQIDALEQAGLVYRETDPANRRSIFLDLTPEGQAIRRQLLAERVGAAEDVFARLTAAQRTILLELLEQIAAQ